MVDFSKTPFGKGKKADRTKNASGIAVSDDRIEVVGSTEMDSVSANKRSTDDIGPWFIGKSVAEIFEIRDVLGRGGMGIVYKAFDTATHRDVAVKVPLGRFVEDERARRLFPEEGRAWTKLVHPNIVHVFHVRDDETTDYRPAIFMDYHEGGSLADQLTHNGQPSLVDGLDIAMQICWAMEFAHEKGIIHRDLKPSNVLLNDDGKALVTDLGLVKLLEDDDFTTGGDGQPMANAGAAATFSVGTAGTPAYMAPEQWAGQACKESDIYALGIMLYELFCGSRPFTGHDVAALKTAHFHVPPPDPKRLNGQLPGVLSALMLECLAKDEATRPRTFVDVAARLDESYQQLNNGQPHDTRRRKPAQEEIAAADQSANAWSVIRIGNGCQLRGDFPGADRCYGDALGDFQALGDQEGIGSCCTNMGNVARARSEYNKATKLYRKSLAICERLGNQAGIGVCYENMGIVAYNRGRYVEAIELYGKALAICERLGDQAGMGSCYINMGNVVYSRSNYDEAMELFRKALAICERLGDHAGMGTC